MRRSALLALTLATALLFAGAAEAASPSPPRVRAHAVIVADAAGNVLYEENADQRRPMASLTKLMTALLTLEHARPKKVIRVSGPAPSVGESTFGLRTGERIRIRDLLTAALVQSANDAAYALATYIGRGKVSRFVRLMNRRAQELGLLDTHYVRPDGLDARGHYSTAADILRLAEIDMKRPLFRKIVRTKGAVVAGRRLYVWNDLLRLYPGTIGVKTGHTDRAGWCEVAAVRRQGVTLYTVILGSPSRDRRNRDLETLLDWGFEHYGRVQLVDPRRVYATADLPFTDERLDLVPADGLAKTVLLGRPLVERVVAPAHVELPVEQGDPVGTIRVYDGSRLVAERPLVAARDLAEPSFARRARWYAGRAVHEARDLLASLSPF